jgi:uncharacterized protein DUF1588/uncharacterized protein DUF1592/uncharacterized protein DUF1585/uncharacterized protein DUF1595/uncharacterized protein DUF1587
VVAAIAGGPGFACAQPGHTGVTPGDDAGGGSSSGSSGSGSGSSGGSASSSGGSVAPPSVGVGLFSAPCTSGQTAVDWSPVRRISRVEYNNMVRDLLGDTTQPANGFPPESPMRYGINFQVNTYAGVSATIVQQYLQAAETLAESVAGDTNRMNNVVLSGIPSCGQAHDDTCAQDFVNSWVNRAYRGQLDSTESAGLMQVYSTVKAQFDWTTGIQAILTAVLESPRFLYVMEFGSGSPSGTVVPLAQSEVAARLALFLWRSVPDTQLMTDVAQGKLATAAGVLAEAQRMLALPNPVTHAPFAKEAIEDFTNQWLQLTGIQAKDAQFMAYNHSATALSEAMYDETRVDVSQLVLSDNGALTDLLTSPSSYIDQDLAGFYGGVSLGSGPGQTVNGQAFIKTQLPNRAGILTTGAVMATQAHSTLPSFVLRGKLVRENVLCDPIPPPPPNIPAGPTSAPDGGTTRDLLLQHKQKGTSCPGCHQYMDPIGVGFGNFDATGAYQATDSNGFGGGPSIDSSGTIYRMNPGELGVALDTTAATFTNVGDLMTQLAAAPQVRQCFALNELRYALGRLETTSDACSAQQIYSAFSAKGFNIQQLLLAIAQSDAFRYRSVETAGSACK